jgi:cell division protein FtsB
VYCVSVLSIVWTHQKKRNNRDRLIVPVISLVVCAYFAHHSLDGRYGSQARVRVDAALADAQARLDTLKTQHQNIDHKVALLRSGSIERDTLDEHARNTLGLIGPNDVVVLAGVKEHG